MDGLVIFCAQFLIIGLALLVSYVWLTQTGARRTEMAMTIIAAGMVALILTKLAGALYDHPRPFVVQQIEPLVAHGSDNGFPSEHTVLATTLTTIIYYYRRRLAGLALVLTLLIGWGRVLADVHSTIDIMSGLVIGAVAGTLGYRIAKRATGSKKTTPKPSVDQ